MALCIRHSVNATDGWLDVDSEFDNSHLSIVINIDQLKAEVNVKCAFVDEEERREAESFRRFLEHETAKRTAAAAAAAAADDDDDDDDDDDVTTWW